MAGESLFGPLFRSLRATQSKDCLIRLPSWPFVVYCFAIHTDVGLLRCAKTVASSSILGAVKGQLPEWPKRGCKKCG